MTTRRLVSFLGAIALPVWPCVLFAEGESVKFDGYSQAAEQAARKMLLALSKVETYSDEAVLKFETGFMMEMAPRDASFVFARPRRFCLKSEWQQVVCDGKELTIYMRNNRRYTVVAAKEDVGSQVKSLFGMMGMIVGPDTLLISDNPAREFAEAFTDLEVKEPSTIDGDRCIKLVGKSKIKMMDASIPTTILIRESDHMIRRIELDMAEAMRSRMSDGDDADDQAQPAKYLQVYDIKGIKLNAKLEESAFEFEAPKGAKKVDRFYSQWMQGGDTASQFELSGKPAPDFELDKASGGRFSMESTRDKVAVLVFIPNMMGRMNADFKPLDEIRRDYEDKGLVLMCIYPDRDATAVLDKMSEQDVSLPVAVDPDGKAGGKYFEGPISMGVVLIGKDGIVQGSYPPFFDEKKSAALRGDLDKLLAGESLPSAVVMTDDEIDEAREQRSPSFFSSDSAEPLNEDDLVETWYVSISSGGGFNFFGGSSGPTGDEIWIRDKDEIKQIDLEGDLVTTIPLPEVTHDQFSQQQFLNMKFNGKPGVLYLKSIPGEAKQMGWRPPKSVMFVAGDESGKVLWKLELDVKDQQVPQQLAAGDIDGRRGDEIVFVHQATLWVVDERGTVLVRKPLSGGYAQWVRVMDRDRNQRAELYVLTPSKLQRLDYRPKR